MIKHLREVKRLAEQEGVTHVHIAGDAAKGHALLTGTYRGRPFSMVVSRGTTKDVVSVRGWIRRTARRRDELARMREANAVR